MIPIEFTHAPNLKKLKKGASDEEKKKWNEEAAHYKLTAYIVRSLKALREQVDARGEAGRKIIVTGDGSATNHSVIRQLPERLGYIGRIRKDAKLFAPPASPSHPSRGRKRVYGERLATPEQVRQDKGVAWLTVKAFASGKTHDFKIKVMDNVRWKRCGGLAMRIVIIAPLGYRLTKNGPVLYRDPAYLTVTDPDLTLEQILQDYLWRWEIEVNFRDEKQLLGACQAHVRTPAAVKTLPAFVVATYAMLHLAALHCQDNLQDLLPQPKWRQKKPPLRLSSATAINLMRASQWHEQLGLSNFGGFDSPHAQQAKPLKIENPFQAAILYARNC